MKKYILLFLAFIVITLSGCKMAAETKSGWYIVHLKDKSGELSGKTVLQVNGEALSRGLHQAVLQYSKNYKPSSDDDQEIFVIITNRRKSEDYIIVKTPDDDAYRFPVHSGGLIFDVNEEPDNDKNSSVSKLIELMSQYEEFKISQGSYYFTINTAGFSRK
jgi:hypothetical protein